MLLLVWVWFLVFRQSPYLSLAVLELTLKIRLAMNLPGLSYFCLLSAKITGLNLWAQPGFHFCKMIIFSSWLPEKHLGTL